MRSITLLKAAIPLLGSFVWAFQAHAGIPVIDGASVAQGTISAVENVAQTLKQIDQYEQQVQQYTTQVDQYKNQVQNTLKPVSQIWDDSQSTINNLISATDMISYYEQQLGSLESYLGKFQDLEYYKASPCFTGGGCTDAQRREMEENIELASKSQKEANDAVFQGIKRQQENLRNDTIQLKRLQQGAEGADGQMQALGYANQLASNQANQLLQIRSLLMVQQAAVANQMQAQADKEAMQDAASEHFWDMGGPTDRSKDKGYKP